MIVLYYIMLLKLETSWPRSASPSTVLCFADEDPETKTLSMWPGLLVTLVPQQSENDDPFLGPYTSGDARGRI